MGERPTPEEIADAWEPEGHRRQLLLDLAEHGYRIVHPDDVPSRGPNPADLTIDYNVGWHDCRAHIFGEGA